MLNDPHDIEIVNDILDEVNRARGLQFGGNTAEFDKTNTKNDWVGFVTAYAGRAADKVARNQREGQTFRANMVKVAALAISAISAHDAGHC